MFVILFKTFLIIFCRKFKTKNLFKKKKKKKVNYLININIYI